MRKTFLTLLSVVAMTMSAQYKSQVWSPDNGDGTFTNPVINADYSDPDVCVGASGEDFYLTASSFNCIPGLPILHSKDLVNWEIINYAIEALPPLERYNIPQHGNGVWAPSIRYNEHNQTYYIYWGDPDLGVFVVTAKDPAGKMVCPPMYHRREGNDRHDSIVGRGWSLLSGEWMGELPLSVQLRPDRP